MPPPPSSLAVDLPLYLLLTSAFTLPLVQSLSSPSTATRTQFRTLLHAVTKAIGLALGGVGVVVLGGGALVLGEKGWNWAKDKFTTTTTRREDTTTKRENGDDKGGQK
ncbi:uncharacterized protein JCM6883_003107 [Sporobolomyces salmoneus]|uniref:uncharacterized protein n=1 Tax=Sporobolomyces salmoneus TaxID=183962 RepID=UPI003174C663